MDDIKKRMQFKWLEMVLAERKGFEPSKGVKALTPLAGERLQPLGHLSAAGSARKRAALQDGE
jgi:hypothetical protein